MNRPEIVFKKILKVKYPSVQMKDIFLFGKMRTSFICSFIAFIFNDQNRISQGLFLCSDAINKNNLNFCFSKNYKVIDERFLQKRQVNSFNIQIISNRVFKKRIVTRRSKLVYLSNESCF